MKKRDMELEVDKMEFELWKSFFQSGLNIILSLSLLITVFLNSISLLTFIQKDFQ